MLEVKRHRFEGIQVDESPHVGGKITPRFIVMHSTAGGSALASVRAIRERGLSAHLVVDRDGGIIQTVPFNLAAFHAGPSSWRGFHGLNQHPIGIGNGNFGFFDRRTSDGWTRTGLHTFALHEVLVARHKGGGPEMAWELYPEAQRRALDAIVAALREAYPTIQEGGRARRHLARPQGRSRARLPDGALPEPGAAGSGTLRDNDLGAFEVVVRDTPNLRGGPGTDFAVLKSLAPGTRLRVLREAGEWCQVDLQGDGTPDGFVHGAFLRRIGA